MVLSGAYFEVTLSGPGGLITGDFLSVSGLGMELDYDIYNEGGSYYPRFFFKNAVPQRLVLEQGVITDPAGDGGQALVALVNTGMTVPMTGAIILKDSFGNVQRNWTIVGAHIVKYEGPQLNSNEPQLAVNRIELIYNGCY